MILIIKWWFIYVWFKYLGVIVNDELVIFGISRWGLIRWLFLSLEVLLFYVFSGFNNKRMKWY